MPPEETSPNIFKISRNQAGIPSMNYVAPATINQYKNYCEDREFVAQCDELCSAAVISPRPQKVTIPGRSRKVIRIGLIQTNLKEGYLPRLDVGYDDVYIGEGIVKNEEGYCNIYAINTQEEEVELNLDPVEIQSFDYVVQDFESDGATELDTPPIEDVKARCDRILKTLRLSELNQEEMESIKGLVMDYPDLFLLPGDSLPCTNWQIRQFLRMAGYYRRFIQDFSKIAKPLHDLTKKGTNFNWSSECENSFQTLKKCLTSAPILIFPDFSKPFILTTDASDLAIGAVLSQEKEGFEHPIGYLSRVLNKAEVNYSTTEKECLAALYAMYQYRPYLLGRPFTLVADHEPLNWMHNRKDPGQRLMRWMFKFTGYQYTFKYKPGKEKRGCRLPIAESSDVPTREKEINEKFTTAENSHDKKKEGNTPERQRQTGQPRKISEVSKPTKPSSEEDSSCIAQRTRSKLNRPSTSATSLKPKKSISSKIDTGLRRRSHPTNPMSAIPEETASTTVLTDEIEEQESPVDALPLVDPSQDCGPYTKNSRLLSDIGAIDYKEIRSRKPAIGQILSIKHKIWARRLEGKMDLQINALREAQNALYKLGEGKIPHQFLNPQTIQNIAIEIQQSNSDLQVPIPPKYLRSEEIMRISTVDTITLQGKTLMVIYIPLVDRKPFRVHKLHSVPIPQHEQDNTTIGGRTYKKPSHPYLLLSEDHKQYIKYDQLEMDKCTKGYHLLICPITTTIRESYLSSECEITLLLNPTQNALKQCNLMFNLEPSTQWYYLSHNSSWLYSIMNQETLEIMCPNEQDTSIKLKGVGILNITPGCQARTREFILQVEEIRKSSRTYIYNPELHLNVTQLYPEMIKIKSLPNLPLQTSGHWNNELTSVNTLLDRMEKIGQHRRETTSTKTFVFSGLSIQGLTLIFIISYIYYRYRLKSEKSRNSKNHSTLISAQGTELSDYKHEGTHNPSFHQTVNA
ncbi:unnamed protein product [Trichogramma brassicae]|uniref:RNA-directed DNA polymerase n=1 Tax=Trichogramma brassicae TaxID=86971 RepID=A0A6H5I6R7_9HYME|nr:unnamed protein product [Trichogramma brassicae]